MAKKTGGVETSPPRAHTEARDAYEEGGARSTRTAVRAPLLSCRPADEAGAALGESTIGGRGFLRVSDATTAGGMEVAEGLGGRGAGGWAACAAL